MRADDRQGAIGATHFDQVLNAVMLLTYVALKQGDAVGAMTFGTPADEERSFAPRKGAPALNALMGELYGVQPTPTHSDYVTAAQDLLRRQRRPRAGHRHHQFPRRGQHGAAPRTAPVALTPPRAAREPARANRGRADGAASCERRCGDGRRERPSVRAVAPRRLQAPRGPRWAAWSTPNPNASVSSWSIGITR